MGLSSANRRGATGPSRSCSSRTLREKVLANVGALGLDIDPVRVGPRIGGDHLVTGHVLAHVVDDLVASGQRHVLARLRVVLGNGLLQPFRGDRTLERLDARHTRAGGGADAQLARENAFEHLLPRFAGERRQFGLGLARTFLRLLMGRDFRRDFIPELVTEALKGQHRKVRNGHIGRRYLDVGRAALGSPRQRRDGGRFIGHSVWSPCVVVLRSSSTVRTMYADTAPLASAMSHYAGALRAGLPCIFAVRVRCNMAWTLPCRSARSHQPWWTGEPTTPSSGG